MALGACYRVCVDDHDLVVVACLAQLRTRDAHSQGVLVPAESVMPAVLSPTAASSCDLRACRRAAQSSWRKAVATKIHVTEAYVPA